MLPLSITMLLFALLVAGSAVYGSLPAGAIVFAVGFLLLGAIAALRVWRSRTPTVF